MVKNQKSGLATWNRTFRYEFEKKMKKNFQVVIRVSYSNELKCEI